MKAKTQTQKLNEKNAAAVAKTRAGAKKAADLQIEVRDGKKTAAAALRELATKKQPEPPREQFDRPKRKDETFAEYLCRGPQTGTCKACIAGTEKKGSFVACPLHCYGCHKDVAGKVVHHCSLHRQEVAAAPGAKVEKGPACLCHMFKVMSPGRLEAQVLACCPVHRPTPEQVINGEPPERLVQPVRDDKGLNRIQAPCGECPHKLNDCKWSSIVEWTEKVRGWMETRGYHLTTLGVLYWLVDMNHLGYTEEGVMRRERAARRFMLLYADEYQRDCDRHDATIRALSASADRVATEARVRAATPGVQPGSPVVPTHSSGLPTTAKRPGVVRKIHELLKAASKKAPATRVSLLVELVKAFPEREEAKMKNTLGGYIPSGVKAERGVVLQADGKGGFWVADADKEKLP